MNLFVQYFSNKYNLKSCISSKENFLSNLTFVQLSFLSQGFELKQYFQFTFLKVISKAFHFSIFV